MIDRGERVRDVFSKPIPLSTNTYILLTFVTISLIVNIEFSSDLPFWVRDLDYFELVLFSFFLISLGAVHVTRRHHRKQKDIGFDLGFERGQPFSISVGDNEVLRENTWRHVDSKCFSFEYGKPNMLKLYYDDKFDIKTKNFLKTELEVLNISSGKNGTVFEIPGESMIDDFMNILEVLRKEKKAPKDI